MQRFQAFAPSLSEELNVFYELERFVVEDARRAAAPPAASVLFATPSEAGTLYEADAMTWRFYNSFPEAIANASTTRPTAPTWRRACAALGFPDASQPVSVSDGRARVLALRAWLFAL